MAWEPPSSMAAFEAVSPQWLASIDVRSDLHLVARVRDAGRCLGIGRLQDLPSAKPELGI
jgi:hypothetical protein